MSLVRPLADIRIHEDSEEMTWSTISQAELLELLDEDLEDVANEEQIVYDSHDETDKEALSEDLAKTKLTEYLQGLEEKDDRLVNFHTRVDIEHSALEAWKAINPRSGYFEDQNQEVIARIVDWLDNISLYQIELVNPGLYMGPIIATKEQELRQKLLLWVAKRHLLDNDPNLARVAELGGGTLRRMRFYNTKDRMKLSIIKRANITNEMDMLKLKISRLTANNSIVSYASPFRFHIIQLQNRLRYLSNARVSASSP